MQHPRTAKRRYHVRRAEHNYRTVRVSIDGLVPIYNDDDTRLVCRTLI